MRKVGEIIKSEIPLEQISNIENYSDDEAELENALIKGNISSDDDPLIGNEGTKNDSNSKVGDPTEIFTDSVIKEYPNVTPLQRAKIASGIEKAIVGLFEYHKQMNENDKVITPETVKEYITKLKNGEVQPKSPQKKE
jgi:hypothetical protein